MKRKIRKLRKIIKKIQTKKSNPIFSVSTLQKIRVFRKAVSMSALPTHCKLSTESFIFR